MSNESSGGGSDLDIFEGLGKTSSERSPAAPPPPAGSSAHLASRPPPLDARKTQIGIAALPAPPPSPSQAALAPPPPPPSQAPQTSQGLPPPVGSGALPPPSTPSLMSQTSKPPPPPGRGSLPSLASTKSSPPVDVASPSVPMSTQKVPLVPPPASTRPAGLPPSARPSSPIASSAAAAPPPAKSGAKLDMDWDDDNEATHVFDKEDKDEKEKVSPDPSAQALTSPESKEPERASMDAILSAPMQPPRASAPPPPPAAGRPHEKTNGSGPPATLPLGAPPMQSTRPAPLPPPSQKSPSRSGHDLPPPPPGQTTTAPMHMPPTQQAAATASPHAKTMQSAQSPAPPAVPSAPPAPQLPPVSRAMDATHMVPRAPNRSPMIALFVAVMALAGVAGYLLMPRSGTLVVNVADSKGAAVQDLEVFVDGTKRCDSAPCIVRDIPADVHEVKVTAKGYDPPAPRAVTVDSRKDVTSDFQLIRSKAAAGTGFKVAAAQPGVKLVVDGAEIGVLPQELRDLEAGEHKLRFVGERYVPLDKTISVAKDEIVDLGTVNLKVAKGKATIQLGTPGAKVYLVNAKNRKEVPQFPMAIEFAPDEQWELQATKDGYDEYRERISFDDGQAEKTFTVSLTPKSTFATGPREPAAPVKKAAANPPAPKEAAKKETTAGEAVLKINSLPASSVVLDGKPIGVTPHARVVVKPGTHTIMFVNAEQSLKKTITVEVKAGETKAAFAKLRE